jgi:hypothetical protein
MRIITHLNSKNLVVLFLLLLSMTGLAQVPGANFKMTLANATFPTPTTLEFDILLIAQHTGTALADGGIKVGNLQYGINFDPAILNGGNPSKEANSGSFTLVPGTRDQIFSGLNFSGANGVGSYRGIVNDYGQLRVIGTLVNGQNAVLIPNGTYRVGRYRFTNTVAWAPGSDAQLWINNTIKGGSTVPAVTGYKNGTTTGSYVYSLNTPKNDPGLSIGYSEESALGVTSPTLDASNMLIFKKDNALHIDAGTAVMNSVDIFDIRGRLIHRAKDIDATKTVINSLKAEQQVILVQITTDTKAVYTRKVAY